MKDEELYKKKISFNQFVSILETGAEMISGWPTFRIMCDTPSSIVIGKQIAFGTPDTFFQHI